MRPVEYSEPSEVFTRLLAEMTPLGLRAHHGGYATQLLDETIRVIAGTTVIATVTPTEIIMTPPPWANREGSMPEMPYNFRHEVSSAGVSPALGPMRNVSYDGQTVQVQEGESAVYRRGKLAPLHTPPENLVNAERRKEVFAAIRQAFKAIYVAAKMMGPANATHGSLRDGAMLNYLAGVEDHDLTQYCWRHKHNFDKGIGEWRLKDPVKEANNFINRNKFDIFMRFGVFDRLPYTPPVVR